MAKVLCTFCFGSESILRLNHLQSLQYLYLIHFLAMKVCKCIIPENVLFIFSDTEGRKILYFFPPYDFNLRKDYVGVAEGYLVHTKLTLKLQWCLGLMRFTQYIFVCIFMIDTNSNNLLNVFMNQSIYLFILLSSLALSIFDYLF